jgi:hypothetical protein
MPQWNNEIPAPEEDELAHLKQNPAEFRRFAVAYAWEQGVAAAVRDVGCTEKQLTKWLEDHMAGKGQKNSQNSLRKRDSRNRRRSPADEEDPRAELLKAFGAGPGVESSADSKSHVSNYLHWLRREQAGGRHPE